MVEAWEFIMENKLVLKPKTRTCVVPLDSEVNMFKILLPNETWLVLSTMGLPFAR